MSGYVRTRVSSISGSSDRVSIARGGPRHFSWAVVAGYRMTSTKPTAFSNESPFHRRVSKESEAILTSTFG